MDRILSFLQYLNLDYQNILLIAIIIIAGTMIIGALGRFIFGKRSMLSCTVSSAIAIIFIYAFVVVLNCVELDFSVLLPPLPFVTIQQQSLQLQIFQGHYTFICFELLSMVILSFLVNMVDRWLPVGKNLFSWIFFRILTILMGYTLYLISLFLITKYLPQGLLTYAPTILLGILILLILTGALKPLVGLALTSVNPLIAGLYTFFFADLIGKQITKAVLTTVLLAGLVFLLNYFCISVINITQPYLIAYVPFAAIMLILWYISNKSL